MKNAGESMAAFTILFFQFAFCFLCPENGRRGQAKRLSIINKPNPRRPDIAFSSYRVSHRDIQGCVDSNQAEFAQTSKNL
jgi:hypothetical protein